MEITTPLPNIKYGDVEIIVSPEACKFITIKTETLLRKWNGLLKKFAKDKICSENEIEILMKIYQKNKDMYDNLGGSYGQIWIMTIAPRLLNFYAVEYDDNGDVIRKWLDAAKLKQSKTDMIKFANTCGQITDEEKEHLLNFNPPKELEELHRVYNNAFLDVITK